MNLKPLRFLLLALICLSIASCIPQKRIEYLQAPVEEKGVYEMEYPPETRISSNDELLINVSSFDDLSFNYFETRSAGSGLYGNNELSLSAMSYVVNNEGEINFPVIGAISFKGLTPREASDSLARALTPYFNQPNVIVRFAFKKITVLGEVRRPGYYTYTKERLNILEAIGIAEDLTIHGDRKEIYLIRTEDEKTMKYQLDLTDDAIVFSDFYYLKPDDIIYVQPRKSVKWSVISTPLTLIFSTVTTAVLVINAVNTNNRL